MIKQGIDLARWPYMQIQSKYDKNARMYNFHKESTELDQILLGTDEKLIFYFIFYLI